MHPHLPDMFTCKAYLGYVGHSLGTSGMFQLLSHMPEFSQYIKPFVALAPVTHVAYIRTIILQVAAHIEPLMQYLG